MAASILAIVIGAELFTNAVEWAGHLLGLGTGATGSLLAALGTSLPETIVPIVAIIVGKPQSTAIATGAVLGSSFMLLRLGVGITGIVVTLRHHKSPSAPNPSPGLKIPASQGRRDLGVFLAAFSVSLLIVPFPFAVHFAWGICLIILYSVYVIATLKGSTPSGKAPEPLHITFHKKPIPHWSLVTLQLVVATAMLIAGSDLFVTQIGRAATGIHINPLLLALVVIPLATEFPETLNSVLWVRSGADSLAFGNVAGSATFQGCILGFIAVSFTPWRLPPVAVISAGLTILTAAYLLFILRNGHSKGIYLLLAALPWTLFVSLEMSLAAIGTSH